MREFGGSGSGRLCTYARGWCLTLPIMDFWQHFFGLSHENNNVPVHTTPTGKSPLRVLLEFTPETRVLVTVTRLNGFVMVNLLLLFIYLFIFFLGRVLQIFFITVCVCVCVCVCFKGAL